MKSDNPNSGIYEAEISRTIDANGGMTPGYYSENYNSIFYNVYFENNETIDNPSVFFRISSQPEAYLVDIDLRYNYVRNTCLAFPERRRLFQWQTSDVMGTVRITMAY